MLYVRITGGIGNQLFQIASAMSFFFSTGTPFRFYIVQGVTHRTFDWPRLASFVVHTLPPNLRVYKEPSFTYTPWPPTLQQGDWDVQGYFQSSCYFSEHTDKILAWIFGRDPDTGGRPDVDTNNNKHHKQPGTIGMHFRMGDYVRLPHCHPVLPLAYYQHALEHIGSSTTAKVVWYCDPQDRAHVWSTFVEPLSKQYTMVEAKHSDDHLWSMAMCHDHLVIANSTFSWWAAYLSRARVYYPSRWFGKHLASKNKLDTLFPPTRSWTRIDCLTENKYTFLGFYDDKPIRKLFAKKLSGIGNQRILVCGPVIKENNLATVRRARQTHDLCILVIFEPIQHISTYHWTCRLYAQNHFDMVFGCIDHNPAENHYKFPLYLFENNFDIDTCQQAFDAANEHVRTVDLAKQRDCALINRWDPANTRTYIYRALRDHLTIDCPGKLWNNMSNKELNRMGNVAFLRKYLANICPENFVKDNVPGYITEKLMNCCLGGAIPVYAGWFDNHDARIFCRDRILFDIQTAERVLACPQTRATWYRKPVFHTDAQDYIHQTLLHDFRQALARKI